MIYYGYGLIVSIYWWLCSADCRIYLLVQSANADGYLHVDPKDMIELLCSLISINFPATLPVSFISLETSMRLLVFYCNDPFSESVIHLCPVPVNDSIETLSLHIWAFELHCVCLWFLYANTILIHEECHHSFYHEDDEYDIIIGIGINFFMFHWTINKQKYASAPLMNLWYTCYTCHVKNKNEKPLLL
jgi:hypothetical protein